MQPTDFDQVEMNVGSKNFWRAEGLEDALCHVDRVCHIV